MNFKLNLSVWMLVFVFQATAQTEQTPEVEEIISIEDVQPMQELVLLEKPKDSVANSLRKSINKGTFTLHKRSNVMTTLNRGDLLDYSAMATGAGIGYYSPTWKGFHLGMSGFFLFQVFQNNIDIPDPTTNRVNRYEIMLFDMNDLNNKKDLDRMEELYLHYQHKGFRLRFGRQKFNSPLLNEQDNRMRGNIFSGLQMGYRWKDFDFTGAFFNQITIRGTVQWYSMQSSLGVYPFGRSPFGVPSEFKGNVRTAGIGVLGVKHKKNKFTSELWNYTADNMFNLSMGQSEFSHKHRGIQHTLGVQGFFQTAINDGGNPDPVKAFILPNEQTFGLGGKWEVKHQKSAFSFNTLHISNQGRFLFPREWGREIFYATLTRERFEGSGGVSAYTLKYRQHYRWKGLRSELGASLVNQSDINDFRINKYGVPSYYHFAGIVDYSFSGYFEGMDLRFIAVNKTAQNPGAVPDVFRINRVDLWHFNVVLNYRY